MSNITKEEKRNEIIEENAIENIMRSDYDYCYESFDFCEDMTIKEFRKSVKDMNVYWDVDECDLYGTIQTEEF